MDSAYQCQNFRARNRRRLAWWGKVISGLIISFFVLVASYIFSRFIP